MRNLIRKEIEKVVGAAQRALPGGDKADFDVFISEGFGDYSSNVAMILKKDPENLKSQISNLKSGLFEKIEVAGPGFLNFWLSEKGMEKGLKNLGKKAAKGEPRQGREKIQVEFISANPTGELHLGHGRNGFYGNALANILEETGYKVEREFFINDSKESTQVKEIGKTALGKGKTYLTENLKSQISNLKSKLPDSESEAGYLLAQEIQKDNQEFITKILGIKFDKWFSEEKELRSKGEFKKTLEMLKDKNLTFEKDGATWLKTSEYEDEEDRVLVRSTGDIGYFLSDIAYHINKFKRGFDNVINVWGADHQGHVKRMLAVKKMLGWKGGLEILICQLVTLKEAGESKKMSKRAGTIVWLKDLIKEVGVDVAKWFCLEKSLSTHMEFDMSLAKERSEKNPVFYVQYANARMASIINKSVVSSQLSVVSIKNLKHPSEISLVKKLIQYKEVIEDIAKDYQVNRLTTYAYELAYAFSVFYRDVHVLGSENEKELLNLVAITKKILQNTLNLLGISTPDKM
ncbi:MAG: arginyl-tRNA synthetase [Parcubacteria group bacterium Athens0714_24]|nr:MAG: arginyl-tRNA synthetase [Parcubacteria group bacterium Athens0714_24]